MLQVFLPEIEYADETYSEKNNTCCIYIKSAPLDYCIAVIPFTGNYGIENVMPLLINLKQKDTTTPKQMLVCVCRR